MTNAVTHTFMKVWVTVRGLTIVFISSSAANTLQDYMILDLGCNNSDHHHIIWSLQCRPSNHISGVNDGSHDNPINKRSYKQQSIDIHELWKLVGKPHHGSINKTRIQIKQEAQLMLTTGSTRLAVSRGQQIWYHSTCNI